MPLTKEQKEEIIEKIYRVKSIWVEDIIISTINLTSQMCRKNLICSTCGFPKNMSREPVFINNDLFSLIHVENNTCRECEHQIDGSSIPIVRKTILNAVEKAKQKQAKEILEWFREIKEFQPNKNDEWDEVFREYKSKFIKEDKNGKTRNRN